MKLFNLSIVKTETLQMHLSALNNTIDNLEADNNFLMGRISELAETNTELDQDLNLHKKHLKETTDDFRTQLEDIKHYKAEIASLKVEIESLKVQLKAAKSHRKKAMPKTEQEVIAPIPEQSNVTPVPTPAKKSPKRKKQ